MNEDTAKNDGCKWTHMAHQYCVPAFRTGWKGVYDAIKAAITGDKRAVYPTETTIDFWVKSNKEVKATLNGKDSGKTYVDGICVSNKEEK
jgi:hypothetical protein